MVLVMLAIVLLTGMINFTKQANLSGCPATSAKPHFGLFEPVRS